MARFDTLEGYAEHIRRECGNLIVPLLRALGTDSDVVIKVADLCTEAAQIVNGKQMEEERADPDRYDLAKLSPVFVNDGADPFREE